MSETTPVEKANEYAIEALKQIITLSSGILALTITFIKDALGDQRSMATATFLVPLSWFFLVTSLWFAWVAIGQMARTLGTLENKPLIYALSPEVEKKQPSGQTKKVLNWTWLWARISQFCFQLGLICLASFAIVNSRLFFISSTP